MRRNRNLLAKNNRTQRAVASVERLKYLYAVIEQESTRPSFRRQMVTSRYSPIRPTTTMNARSAFGDSRRP